MREYSVYKGLQKPLVFKGLKGRYIYWGAGFAILSLMVAGIVGAFFSLIAGVVAMASILGGGFYHITTRQKKGLYDKSRSGHVHVFQANLKGNRYVKKESV